MIQNPAPETQAMLGTATGSNSSLDQLFGQKNAILVKQTSSGCFQEILGCEATSEYKISNMDYGYMQEGVLKEGAESMQDEMYAIENSSCCVRFFWRDGRGMTLAVSEGADAGGAPVVQYEKPCGCPLLTPLLCGRQPCCCFLPELNSNVGGQVQQSTYKCDPYCCVSKFEYREDDRPIYILKPDSCCLGCCPLCKCNVPYFFYDADTGERITDGQSDDNMQPRIHKVWSGCAQECCTTADTFAVFFPQGIDTKRKAGLLGLTFLIDFSVFERQGKDMI